jgi:hypothetical protein
VLCFCLKEVYVGEMWQGLHRNMMRLQAASQEGQAEGCGNKWLWEVWILW